MKSIPYLSKLDKISYFDVECKCSNDSFGHFTTYYSFHLSIFSCCLLVNRHFFVTHDGTAYLVKILKPFRDVVDLGILVATTSE